MCRYIQGNHCTLREKCHCHPSIDNKEYDGSNEYLETIPLEQCVEAFSLGQLSEAG